MLPLADRQGGACSNCQITTVALVIDTCRVIVVGTTYWPGGQAAGWAPWVGTVATP